MKYHALVLGGAIAMAALAAGQAKAQYGVDFSGLAPSGGITVYGSGEASAKPDLVEIGLRATATAELTADAIVKYSDTKRRTLESFDNLKLERLEVEELGVSLANGNSAEAMQMMMRGMPADTAGKVQVEISSALVLRLSGIRDKTAEEVMETVGKLLDAARDSGANVGPSAADLNMAYRYGRQPEGTLVRFVVRDLDKLREAAYEAAVAEARARAERLAKLNGIKLGEVTSVQEVSVSGDEAAAVAQPWQVSGTPAARPKEPQITSDSFAEVPFRVRLMVRFGIAPADEKTAQN